MWCWNLSHRHISKIFDCVEICETYLNLKSQTHSKFFIEECNSHWNFPYPSIVNVQFVMPFLFLAKHKLHVYLSATENCTLRLNGAWNSVRTETRLHWENYISSSFQIEWDIIVGAVFLSNLNQMEIHLVQNRKENCHHNHIPFNLKGNGNIVFSVYMLHIVGIYEAAGA